MLMIVFIHANMYLTFFCSGPEWHFLNGLVNGICNIGVTCFILISGYFGMTFKLRKLVKMECMMITYSLLETALLYICMPQELQGAALLEQLVKSLMPFATRKYWFYSSYVCLMIFSGFIQKLIDSLKQKQLEVLLGTMLLLFSLLPTVFYFEIIPDNGKGLVQMMMIYMIGRYIRKYRDEKLPAKAWILFFVLWALNGVSHEFPISVGGIYHHLCKDNSLTNICMAVILFYAFKELHFTSKLVNRAAGYLFAVFALNNSLVNCLIPVLQESGWSSPGGLPGFLILVGIVLAVLVICILIGAVRELLLAGADRKIGDLAEAAQKKAQGMWKRKIG